jgi:hypothetical protein
MSPLLPRTVKNLEKYLEKFPALTIGVTVALLGHLLPSDGPFITSVKTDNFGPKVLLIVDFLAGRVILKFVWQKIF